MECTFALVLVVLLSDVKIHTKKDILTLLLAILAVMDTNYLFSHLYTRNVRH